jgi:hypothetical protein
MKGKTLIGTGGLSAGLASFATSALKVGTRVITASYSGNSTLSGSKSMLVKRLIEKAVEPPISVKPQGIRPLSSPRFAD